MSEFEKKIIEYKQKIKNSKDLKDLLSINSEIFGKNGIINLEFKKMGSLSADEKKFLLQILIMLKKNYQIFIKQKVARY